MSVVASQPSSSGAAPPSPDWPALEQVMARAGRENFPVASRLLPPAQRAHLRAVYGFARLTDDLGDEWPGDRTAALAWLDAQLDAARAGGPAHPAVAAAARTVRQLGVGDQPLRRLIEANRVDQVVHRSRSGVAAPNTARTRRPTGLADRVQ